MLMQTHEARLSAVREELKRQSLHGFIVPICDEHMSEYVGSYAQRLEWLTGFGGSAGTGAVLLDKAAVIVDGRYTIQIRQQVDARLFEPVGLADQTAIQWVAANVPDGARIGYDAWLHPQSWVNALAAALATKGAVAVPVTRNPIDAVWADQPERSDAKLMVHGDDYAGESAAAKRTRIAAWLAERNLDTTVMTALDSVAWAFNIRGADIARTPVPLSFALFHADGRADLFVAPEKLTPEVQAHLGNEVAIWPYDALLDQLDVLAGKRVAVDPERVVCAIRARLEAAGATLVEARDPSVLMKAIKNPVEAQGHRDAQHRDGAALSKFLHWLSVEAPKGGQDELSAAARLKAFREETGVLVDLSFDTISAAGPNGALCHYKVDEQSNRPIETGTLYLVDSGGQYRDGTTDVTRTIAVGTPTDEMRRRFTQVLQGHIALATAVFPTGTPGGALDVLARQYLWADGVDYAHGTGHGVGAFLAVHEGPQRIGMSAGVQAGTNEPLQAGMLLSNEPGYYKTDGFGIRIENLILVEERQISGAEGAYLGFETVTFAPIDRALIDVTMLDDKQLAWVNNYHANVEAIIAPQLQGDALAWIKAACAALDS